jgi:hypothetical protein
MRAIQFRLLLLVASVTIHPRTISVSCSSSRLTDINNKLHDISVLSKQSPSGVWLLSANLVIAKGVTFHIDSTDTKWLKINSKVDRSGGPKIGPAYIIDVIGSLKIDSVKITSWDPTTNNYAITNGSRTGTDIFILGAPRPSIVVDNNATGTTDIFGGNTRRIRSCVVTRAEYETDTATP